MSTATYSKRIEAREAAVEARRAQTKLDTADAIEWNQTMFPGHVRADGAPHHRDMVEWPWVIERDKAPRPFTGICHVDTEKARARRSSRQRSASGESADTASTSARRSSRRISTSRAAGRFWSLRRSAGSIPSTASVDSENTDTFSDGDATLCRRAADLPWTPSVWTLRLHKRRAPP